MQRERIFDDDQLWDELNGNDAARRAAALRALEALGELAMLRAAADGIAYAEAWEEVFDWKLLREDLDEQGHRAIHHAAWRVWDEVTHLVALRAEPTITAEERAWGRELLAAIQARFDAMLTLPEATHA